MRVPIRASITCIILQDLRVTQVHVEIMKTTPITEYQLRCWLNQKATQLLNGPFIAHSRNKSSRTQFFPEVMAKYDRKEDFERNVSIIGFISSFLTGPYQISLEAI